MAGLIFVQIFKIDTYGYANLHIQFMECAIGRASRAMALPDFKLVGPAIHLALPKYFLKIVNLSKYFH